jgi:hypothetical protein
MATQAPFEHLRQLWQDVLSPALQTWHAMSDEERQEWEDKCPPNLKNGLTFFMATHLYGGPPEGAQEPL